MAYSSLMVEGNKLEHPVKFFFNQARLLFVGKVIVEHLMVPVYIFIACKYKT